MNHPTITPVNESLAARDAIRSLKRGSGRCHAQRSNEIRSLSHVIVFPQPFMLPTAASN